MSKPIMHRVARIALFMGVAFVAAPPAVHADFLVAPFFAWTRNPDTERLLPGGGLNLEVTYGAFIAGSDLGYAGGFFDPEDEAYDLIESSHVLTVSGVAGVTMPSARERRFFPYATAGFGIMRQQARDRTGLIDVTRNDPAFNVGGGVRVAVNDFLQVRGDVRYFRSMRDPYEDPGPLVADLERLAFWRVGAGITLRFGEQ